MRSLIELCEGLLDADYDASLPEFKNWDRAYARLNNLSEPETADCKYGLGYYWYDTDVLEALTQIVKKDLGKAIGKNKASDIAIDREDCVICLYKYPNESGFSEVIYIGNNDKAYEVNTVTQGSFKTKMIPVGKLSLKIATLPNRNFIFKSFPGFYYKYILDKLCNRS